MHDEMVGLIEGTESGSLLIRRCTSGRSLPKLPLPQATAPERVDLPAIRNAIAVVRHLLQLFRLELQDPNARRKLRRLAQRLLTLSHVLDQKQATARLRFLFVVAKIWKHSGWVGISYSDQYAERGLFQRLMERLPDTAKGPASFLPVLARPLTC
jgi:hypothetical protein